MEALISLIMPFRNTEKYLPDCLDSILAQSYPHWELIMVDDHSTDRSAGIAREYSQLYSNIKVLENSGQGIIPALQKAYQFASGHLISRMDSDDQMQPNRLKIMESSLRRNGPGHLAVGMVKYISEQGISNGYRRYEEWINSLTAEGNNFLELYKECVVPSPCWLAYRSDFEACGAFHSTRYPEDYDLTFRFYEAGLKIIPCDQVLHFWRDYPERTSRNSEHYAQNFFLDLKLHYFLKLNRSPERPLVIWGAGSKGKHLASALLENEIEFYWMCDNPNKIGKKIYGVPLHSFTAIDELARPQIIVTVANPLAQTDIEHYLHKRRMKSMDDFFFFC